MKRAVAWLAFACLTSDAVAQSGPVPGGPGAAIVNRAPIDGRSDVGFSAMVSPETVYVGQQATYQVGVFLSEQVRARLRRNPQFQPPEVRSTLAFDLPALPGTLTRDVGSRRYDVHVFQRALFPLTTGTHVIPSARLDYALPLSNSFFAREENHSVRTRPVPLVALEPPERGRPDDYRGAVGRLSVSARVDSRRARVGDPLMFTLSVDGVANVTLLPRPHLQVPWGDVVPSGERVALDSSSTLIRGRKDFDWIVTPRQAGAQRFPPVRYPYFNPYTEQYEVVVTRAESITVAAGTAIATGAGTATTSRALPIRRVYEGEVPMPLPSHAAYWLVIALAPVPALALALQRRPARPRARSPMDDLDDLAASPSADPAALRRAYAAAMAARVHVTPAAMSDHSVLVRTLCRAGVSSGTAAAADRMLAELDAVVYGGSGSMKADAPRRAREIVRAIDAEARTPESLARSRPVVGALVVLMATVAVSALAAVQSSTERVFRDGVAAYDERRFGEARDAFAELAEARPRAPDAWVNFGSASWELADTAAATVAWQRAARLEPMAGDIRRLLELTPTYRSGFLGDVPPVSLQWLAVIGALAWFTGWGVIAASLRPNAAVRPSHGLAPLALAGLVALGGVKQAEILSGHKSAVVVSPARVRQMPTLAAETGSETVTGEVVRVLGRQGVWTLVRTMDGRRGWLESSRLRSVAIE